MKRTTLITAAVFAAVAALALPSCDESPKSSDQKQQEEQERILSEGTSQVGMPAIKNFRERKLLKDIYEMRDQEGLTTYTYVFSEQTGKFTFLGQSFRFGVPYATQFTSPQKVELFGTRDSGAGTTRLAVPQADPNGLFSPAAAEGTWVMMKDPNGRDAHPVYIEPRIVVSPFPLPDSVLQR